MDKKQKDFYKMLLSYEKDLRKYYQESDVNNKKEDEVKIKKMALTVKSKSK